VKRDVPAINRGRALSARAGSNSRAMSSVCVGSNVAGSRRCGNACRRCGRKIVSRWRRRLAWRQASRQAPHQKLTAEMLSVEGAVVKPCRRRRVRQTPLPQYRPLTY
jgi:hypothetical protein